MKFIVSSSSLLKQLQNISGVLNSSNSLPILDHFLFEISENEVKVTASDLETTMMTIIKVDSKEEGTIAIPAKLLLDTLKSLPDQPLTFSIDLKTFAIEISSDYGKYKLSGQNAAEFPKTPQVEAPSKIEVAGELLFNAIEKTIFASGNDDLRPVMSGVFFQLSKDDLTFVATDAHKLVKYVRTDAKASKAASFIMPKKPLNLLKNILSSMDDNIQIEYNQTNASFSFENTQLICRLIDGKYPNYEAVIPKENPNKLTIDRSAFLGSIKRVGIFSSKTTHQVRLKMTGSELQISAEDVDFSNEAVERLTCQFEGEDMEIGFNSRFLIEMLSNLSTDEVNIAMSASNRAGILTPTTSENDDEQVLMLVMPVMLNS
ncbi:MAG: DNA polymerase III subunit beta [Bacteroidetes bacterium]|nr:DNA polymerase III subunit beta [Bacteroidota bacterium]MCB0802394.1 DNA polymerase III subunit beta [Flavobacteriales bacterium]NOG56755.1 DNA polymerase III subunit beta [Bacteroidota bacterium]